MELVMPSSHLILCRPLLLLPPIPPSIRVFSNESTLCMRWPKCWSFFHANCSNIHNSQSIETTSESVNWWMDKDNVVCVCVCIYIYTPWNTIQPWKKILPFRQCRWTWRALWQINNTRQKKMSTVYGITCMWNLIKPSQTLSRMVAVREIGRGW